MKNAILKFSLTALATLTLAACGSSGDAGSRSQALTKDKPAAQTTQPAKKQTQPVKEQKNSSSSVSTSSNNKTGGAIVGDSDNKGNVTAKTVDLTSANLYKINVDGKDIPIGFGPGISARGWTQATAKTINGMKLNGKLEVCCGFSGTAKSDLLNSQGKAEGKFYGENAKELGGSAKANDNSWVGAYGAKAQ